jgi:hypothetical protein
LRQRKSRQVIDCRDFVFDAVSLQKNKVKRAFYEQALGGNPLVLKTDTSGRAVVDSLVASQIAGRYIVTASLGISEKLSERLQRSHLMGNGTVTMSESVNEGECYVCSS